MFAKKARLLLLLFLACVMLVPMGCPNTTGSTEPSREGNNGGQEIATEPLQDTANEPVEVGGQDGGERASESHVEVSAEVQPEPPVQEAKPSACPGLTKPEKQNLSDSLEHKESTRYYKVHLPDGYDPSKAYPVVLNFHGYGQYGGYQEILTGMNSKADEAQFIAVHPEGSGAPLSWNAGGTGPCLGAAQVLGSDDVGFTDKMIDALAQKYCIDKTRVYATGFSNGALLAHRLACELSHKIAAIAPVAGTLAFKPCSPPRPVPMIAFNGTGDAAVPYYGNVWCGYPSVSSTFEAWAKNNKCEDDEPQTTFDKSDVECQTYTKCQDGAVVTQCKISGGVHAWPGGVPNGAFVPTYTINATDMIWSFFQQFKREQSSVP